MRKITGKAVKDFENYLRNEEKAQATVEKYIRDLSAFAVWLGDGVLCKQRVIEYK